MESEPSEVTSENVNVHRNAVPTHPEIPLPIPTVHEIPEGRAAKDDMPIPLVRPAVEALAAKPPHLADRMISGIDLIDYGVGGLLPNKVYLVKGNIGVGKTILGLQYITRGLEHQEPGIIITDQRPATLLAQAKSIGFPIEDAVRREQLLILNPSTRYFELVESPADVMAIVEELGDYLRKVGAKRIVIDSVHALINTHYSSYFALTLTQSLLNALEDLPATTLLVSGDQDSPELNPVLRMLEHNAFGVISLENDPATGGRIMHLSKLRYANVENLSASYRILDGHGLINYQSDGERVADVTRPWEETGTSNRRVILLGAQPETIRRVQEALGNRFEISAESDLVAGVQRVKREKPGLVLVTPSRSAGSVAAILDLAQTSSSSIAFLSPWSNRQSDKVLYLRAGADDFIAEPFHPREFRARMDALLRRSGRRLNVRDSGFSSISANELAALVSAPDVPETLRSQTLLSVNDENEVTYRPEFLDRMNRNIQTVTKFDTAFAVYWIKGDANDIELNKMLAKLCRQEDILCHNRNGEFVSILTGTDADGVRGFERRLEEKIGDRLASRKLRRGYQLYSPGDVVEGHA